MKILIVSLLKRSVTPTMTASRPRMIYELAKGLIAKGHEVTILGTEDSSVPGAKIIGVIPKSFTELPAFENPFYAETSYLIQLAKKIEALAPEFDVIHNHTYPEFINLMAAERIKTPMITTLHAQATPEFDAVLSSFPDSHLISISQAHRSGFTNANIDRVVYNGIDTKLYAFEEKKDDYLLWIGRLGKSKNDQGEFMDAKGIRWAIQLAEASGERLLLSGNVEDKAFFEKDVKPHLNDKIQWIGNISSEQPLSKEEVVKHMQKAKAFLMTINWEEPFGLVMAEAMSCGTPVIGFKRGAVPEVIADGKTGFVVDPNEGVSGLQKALEKLDSVDPKDCRAHVEEHFSIEAMINNYEKVYQEYTG
jgi:glycosyltransferase involved in cell wall biosynthesis